MLSFLNFLRLGLSQLILPNTCWLCERHLPDHPESFCSTCRASITLDPFPTCPRCGSTVGAHVPLEKGCVHCSNESYAFQNVVRLGEYDGLLRETILRMKQAGGEALAEAVAFLFAEQIAPRVLPFQPDLVVPIPLHWTRYWQRSFNQSEALARALAGKLGKPCRIHVLRRLRRTQSQTSQSPTQRRENVKDAFVARGVATIQNRTVLLVDDVLTTGATMHEAARAIRKLRPARIVVAVLAKSKTH